MHRIRTAATALLLLGLVVGTSTACDDATSVGDHAEAEGVAILDATDTEIYRYMLDDGLPDTFVLAVGAYDVAIVLLDADGQPLVHEDAEGEDEEELTAVAAPATVLTWSPEAETGEPHVNVEAHGTLTAVAQGLATLDICLEHGGHCDFEATIPVTVNAGQ